MLRTISSAELARVSGGEQKFSDYRAAELKRVMPAYANVVCTGAGVEGGPLAIKEMYGDNAGDDANIIGSEGFKGLCQKLYETKGILPAKAPKTPF